MIKNQRLTGNFNVYPASFDGISFHSIHNPVGYIFRYVDIRKFIEDVDAADAVARNIGFARNSPDDVARTYIIPTADGYHQAGHISFPLTRLTFVVFIKIAITSWSVATATIPWAK